MPMAIARPDPNEGGAVVTGVGVAGTEPCDIRRLTDDLGCGQRRAAAARQKRRCLPRDENFEVTVEFENVGSQFAATLDQSSGPRRAAVPQHLPWYMRFG